MKTANKYKIMSHWNHRVIRTPYNIGEKDPYYTYGIHEVYYDEDGPFSWTVEPIKFTGDSVEDIKWSLEKMLECLSKPVLQADGDKLVEVKV